MLLIPPPEPQPPDIIPPIDDPQPDPPPPSWIRDKNTIKLTELQAVWSSNLPTRPVSGDYSHDWRQLGSS